MSYTTLGDNCKSQTIAITSNDKYISPLSNVYYKHFTPMMYYPGHDSMYGQENADKPFHFPEHIKTFHNYENNSQDSMQQKRKNCQSCNTLN